MLLSDRELKAALASGRMGLAPYDEAMVQPSSIDVRLDRYFRVFANHRYTQLGSAGRQDRGAGCVFANSLEHPADAVVGLAASLGLRPVKRKQRTTRAGVDVGPAYRVNFALCPPKARAVVAVRPVPSLPVRCIEAKTPRGARR
jgi:hypothetical protein